MKIKDLTRIAFLTAIIIICSYITIPFAVPFTLQTLGVFLSVLVLGKNKGSFAVLIYLLIGIIGVPVFSGMKGGIGVLLSPTGGYLTGFLACAYITGIIYEKTNKPFLSCISGLMVLYTAGTVWFYIVNPVSFVSIIATCILPFIIPDVLKIALAVYIKKVVR